MIFKKTLSSYLLVSSIMILNYVCGNAQICSGTLGAPVFNEDFGAGASIYGPLLPIGVTGYQYLIGVPINGSYAISNTGNPSGTAGYVPDNDHTGNPNGYMMVVNADYGPTEVYRKHITGLCQNTTYVFSAYLANNNTPASVISNCGSSYIYANVNFRVEYPASVIQASVNSGNLPLATTSSTFNWQQYGFVFTTISGQTSADIIMSNNAPGGCGNDYVVDDITFSPCGPGVSLSTTPNNAVFCAGTSATLQSTFNSGGYITAQYQWQFSNDNGLTWNNIAGATSQNYPIVNVAAANSGLYRLLIAESGNITLPSCRIMAGPITFSVAGTSGPPIAVSGNTLICTGGATTLTASSSGGYFWNTSQTAQSIVVNPSVTTNYTVSSSLGLCGSSAVITVSVVSSPMLSVTGNQSLCVGETTTLTVSGANTYSWNQGANTPIIIINPQATTSYSVIGAIGTCTAQAITVVNVIPTPTLSISGNTLICAGQQVSLTASGANTYVWNTGVTTSTLHDIPTSGITYSVIGSVNTCTSQALFSVGLIPLPPVSIAGSTLICLGQSAVLFANGATTYTWSNGSSQQSNTVTPITSSSYTVTGTNGNCTNTAVATVSVSNFSTSPVNTSICSGQQVTLSGSGAYSYNWSTGATGSSILVNPVSTTNYTLTGSIGSCTNIAVFTVSVSPTPVIVITRDSVICGGKPILLMASGAITYHWDTGVLTNSIIVTPSVTSSYSVIGAIGSCTAQAVSTVSVFTMPEALYSLSPNPVTQLTPLVYFTNQSVNYFNWYWDFGDGSPLDSVNINPAHHYDDVITGSYLTTLTIKNAFGCVNTKGILLKVEPEFTFYIPNAFTPNNDGINDTFKGVGIGIVAYKMQIFDRWGKCIYATEDLGEGWNGSLNNKGVTEEQGTYTWKVIITDILKIEHTLAGHVSLLN